MTTAAELRALLEAKFGRGQWFTSTEAVVHCGVWSYAVAGGMVARGELICRELGRYDTRRRARRAFEYQLPKAGE